MSREFKFFIYLLERYAESKGVTADVMLNRLKANGLLDYAIGMYELYHVESIENAFADLELEIFAVNGFNSQSSETDVNRAVIIDCRLNSSVGLDLVAGADDRHIRKGTHDSQVFKALV